ncbi:hypothetical protein RHIZ404_220758 [Rhizobium sp. EC-SD404]|nr:hypothetical protein RHIZ404_220758 [Rhizobium sp. EC-SD404]
MAALVSGSTQIAADPRRVWTLGPEGPTAAVALRLSTATRPSLIDAPATPPDTKPLQPERATAVASATLARMPNFKP